MKRTTDSSKTLVVAATATSVFAIAQQVMGRATRDALFLSSFEVERLPPMMIGAAFASVVAVFIVSRLIALFSPARVIPWAFGTSGVLLAIDWLLSAAFPRPIAVVIYLHWAVFGGTLVSMFWSVINERFDPRTAKKYVGWIGSGGTVGGIFGGIAAFGASRAVDLRGSLLALSAMHFVCAVTSMRLGQGAKSAPRSSDEKKDKVAPTAFSVLAEVPYLRNLALLVATVAAMEALADYTLNAEAKAHWASGAELLSFFSLFHLSVSFITFLLQTVFGRRVLERLGLVGTMAILPIFVIPGAGLAAVLPRLWSAGVLRGSMAALGNSLYRSGYELLFSPLPLEKKRPTKTVIDVAFDRLGTTVGSGLALSALAIAPSLVPVSLLIGVLGLAVLSLAVTRRLQAGYVRLLEDSLTIAPSLKGSARPELGLSQTYGHMNRAALMKEIDSLRRDNLLMSGEIPSPFAWSDVAAAAGSASETSNPPPAPPSFEPSASEGASAPPGNHKGAAHKAAFEVPSSELPREPLPATLSAPDHAAMLHGLFVADERRSSSAPPPSPRDTFAQQAAALMSSDPPRVREALDGAVLDPRLTPLVIALLDHDDVQKDAVRALRTVANRIPGQLSDALLDRNAPPAVRRRVARVMSACTTQRGVDALVEGLADDHFEVRYQCGLSLLKVTQGARLVVARDAALAAVRREVDLEHKLWQHNPPLTVDEEPELSLVDGFLRDRTSRSLQHVFSVLALVFEREPMRLALTALSGDDENLRGTALEYLDEVLPPDIKASLWPHVTTRRSRDDVQGRRKGAI